MARAKVSKTKPRTTRTRRAPTLGFGVPATSDPHHFKVTIPKSTTGNVLISEYLGLQASDSELAVIDRVLLDRSRWTTIRSEVQRAFNARLVAHELKSSAWKVGQNPVDRLLGKELCVIAWAVEQLRMDKLPVAIRNWLALRPEERWWLFGMTAMNTGGVSDGGKGWRLALQHALGDIAQSEQWARDRHTERHETIEARPTLDTFACTAAAQNLPHCPRRPTAFNFGGRLPLVRCGGCPPEYPPARRLAWGRSKHAACTSYNSAVIPACTWATACRSIFVLGRSCCI
jgi:hypothetical protein